MAYYEEKKNGSIRVQIRMSGVKPFSETFRYRWEAVRWADAQEAAIRETGERLADLEPAPPMEAAEPRGVGVAAYARDWLARREGELAAASVDDYGRAIRSFDRSALRDVALADLTRAHVQTWRTFLVNEGAPAPTMNRRLKVLRMVCRDAVLHGLAPRDATAGLKLLNTDLTAERPLTQAEIAKLTANATPTTAAMVLVATDAGLRFAEVVGLTTRAVDLERGLIHVTHIVERLTRTLRAYPKGGSRAEAAGARYRTVPIASPRLLDALTAAVAAVDPATNPDRLLFSEPPSRRSGSTLARPLRYDSWRSREWEPLMRAVQLDPPIRFHDLRHTFGTAMAEAGIPRAGIATLMGHSDEKTTGRYIHPGDNAERADAVRRALSGAR